MDRIPAAGSNSALTFVNQSDRVNQPGLSGMAISHVQSCSASFTQAGRSGFQELLKRVLQLPPELTAYLVQYLRADEVFDAYRVAEPECKHALLPHIAHRFPSRDLEKIWHDVFLKRTICRDAGFYETVIEIFQILAPELLNSQNDEGDTALIAEMKRVEQAAKLERQKSRLRELPDDAAAILHVHGDPTEYVSQADIADLRAGLHAQEKRLREQGCYAIFEHVRVIEALLEANAEVGFFDKKNRCALGIAVENRQDSLVGIFLKQPGIHLNIAQVIMDGIYYGQSDYMELLVDCPGFDVNQALSCKLTKSTPSTPCETIQLSTWFADFNGYKELPCRPMTLLEIARKRIEQDRLSGIDVYLPMRDKYKIIEILVARAGNTA